MSNFCDLRGVDAFLLSKRLHVMREFSEIFDCRSAYLKVIRRFSKLKSMLEMNPDIDFLFIDIDSHESWSQYDDISEIRMKHADIPVILLSDKFNSNEFDAYRRVLGDVSLRLPVDITALSLGLLQAPVNNQSWQSVITAARFPDPATSPDHAKKQEMDIILTAEERMFFDLLGKIAPGAVSEDHLRKIAAELVVIRRHASQDWHRKKNVHHKIRLTVLRLIKRHGLPRRVQTTLIREIEAAAESLASVPS